MLAASLFLVLLPPGPPAAVLLDRSGEAQVSADGRLWQPAVAGRRIGPGERLRATGPFSVRLDLGEFEGRLGEAGLLEVEAEGVILKAGRLALHGTGRAMVAFAGGTLAGSGAALVLADSRTAAVSVIDGAFELRSGASVMALAVRQGAIVRDGALEGPLDLPGAPRRISPAADPVYTRRGQPVSLIWEGPAPSNRVTVERSGGGVVREVVASASSIPLVLEEPGLYRWRVASQDPRGLEGLPSETGYICVVER